MEDQTPQNPELHRRNNYSIRRKPLHDENAKTSGSEEENQSPAPESPAPAPKEDSEPSTRQGTGIQAIIKSIWTFLNFPVVANAFSAFILIQCTIAIMEKRQAARNADKDRDYMALLVVVNKFTNQVNYLTEKVEAMAQNLE
ncbi:hypothetical protein N7448_006671 [Penicillium atrosanguineum]|uniref:Uncharacterized protein n=1 Tax=Penicillium atrosanguineum TaxID=1132637 RepID=A0A9W9PUW1_9EURO|nr:uncharacterized protein N7443_010432 [Penicillium atrosanguineum]KAJ5132513.1 hypothetical protein N7448_006671 [Penicillium atrosanguineum]KAJ5137274.1 hypothetical protein N7526_003507 [Penicillium atrosanguineum]KAJ5290179.1 hypothetical protein N7443_010432 [Penicillium atrosanguineum]KAJ5308003.1 hypothetical protein N7476_008659 [Penicillium atrosanguineum]